MTHKTNRILPLQGRPLQTISICVPRALYPKLSYGENKIRLIPNKCFGILFTLQINKN